MEKQEIERKELMNFLQWNDPNGCYTDKNTKLENVPQMTYEKCVIYFFHALWNDLYIEKYENAFELDYDTAIKIAKEHNVYELGMSYIEKITNSKNKKETYIAILNNL